MIFRFLLCVCLIFQIIQAKTDEEIRTWFFRQALECNKDHPVSAEEMQMLQKHKVPDSKNAKCLMACVFKKANFLNDKGMFDVEGATAQAAKDHSGDATKVENSKKLMEICGKINSETVSDGEAGCDRALLLFKCFSENAPQLGFPMHVTN
ncbi:general odorant-binding protein 19d-like [Anticarsia gemmatalis]|uniref:general odorant-binding protein 19d-like n=1 Tax=Anticarsia gemmatalis TaxID=129554 RepID=UPI003F75875A